MRVLRLYTDGSCRPQPGEGGYAWIAVIGAEIVASGRGYIGSGITSNTAELVAIKEALLWARAEMPERDLEVITDSQSAEQSLLRAPEWIANQWRGSQNRKIKNWRIIAECFFLYNQPGINIRWERGHSGVYFNELADRLAKRSRDEKVMRLNDWWVYEDIYLTLKAPRIPEPWEE